MTPLFVANDHVHEPHDIKEGLSVPGNIVDGSRNSNVGEEDVSTVVDDAQLTEKKGLNDEDDEINFSPEEEREMELILERQSKRAREDRLSGDKESKSPPPQLRAARRPRQVAFLMKNSLRPKQCLHMRKSSHDHPIIFATHQHLIY